MLFRNGHCKGKNRPAKPWVWWRAGIVVVVGGCLLGSLWAQAGRRSHPTGEGSSTLNVVAFRENESAAPITTRDISLFDNGVEQIIKNFVPDRSAARIVLLVDNSLTIRADVE